MLARWNRKGNQVMEFFFKCIVYFIFFGLPLALVVFLIFGCVWLGQQVF